MINLFFELDRLRHTLQSKGVDDRTISNVVAKARSEIEFLVEQYGQEALDQAVEAGVQKRSPEFINELRLDTLNFEVDTESRQTDFSEPPRPMLPFLLKNAKPMKDGTGFYKVIPVGKPSDRQRVSTSIVDAQKRIVAERAERAKSWQKSMAPQGSVTFRTVTSKQDPTSQWVQPKKDKDFTGDLQAINEELTRKLDSSIQDIINSYLEMF